MGGVYPGTHLACSRLMKLALDGEKYGSPEVVVDIVKKFDVDEDSFPGFYVASFPTDNCVLPSAKGCVGCNQLSGDSLFSFLWHATLRLARSLFLMI